MHPTAPLTLDDAVLDDRIRYVDPDELDVAPQQPFRRSGPKLGPNAPCPCGSGKKLKKCCRDQP